MGHDSAGAAFGEVTMLSGFEVDITPAVRQGAMVEIDPVLLLLLQGSSMGPLTKSGESHVEHRTS